MRAGRRAGNVELRDVSSMGGGQLYDRYGGHVNAKPGAWGVYSL
jgi:hypothetical protein